MNSFTDQANAIREIIQLWVENTQTPSNVRGQSLLSASSFIDGRVFDDYSAGLKLYITEIRPNNHLKRPGHLLWNVGETSITTTYQTRSIDGVLTDPTTSIKSLNIDQKVFDILYKPTIKEILKKDAYTAYFGNNNVSVETTKKYLRNFYAFTDADFLSGDEWPFANLFIMETHISILYYFAKYCEEKAAIGCYQIPEQKGNRDYIGIKELQTRTTKSLKNCEELLKSLSQGDDYFGRQMGANTPQNFKNMMYLYHELSVNQKNLSMYKQTDKICEAFLVARITNDILSLDIYNNEYPGIPCSNEIRRTIEEYFAFDSNSLEISDSDFFATAYPVCNNTNDANNYDFIKSFEQFSYSLPRQPRKKAAEITGRNDVNSIAELTSIIEGWLEHSPARDSITHDIVDNRVKSLKKAKKKPYQWNFDQFLKTSA